MPKAWAARPSAAWQAVPAAVLAGRVALTPEQWAPLDLRAVRSINPTGATLEDARVNAAAYYRTALETLLKEWK